MHLYTGHNPMSEILYLTPDNIYEGIHAEDFSKTD